MKTVMRVVGGIAGAIVLLILAIWAFDRLVRYVIGPVVDWLP